MSKFNVGDKVKVIHIDESPPMVVEAELRPGVYTVVYGPDLKRNTFPEQLLVAYDQADRASTAKLVAAEHPSFGPPVVPLVTPPTDGQPVVWASKGGEMVSIKKGHLTDLESLVLYVVQLSPGMSTNIVEKKVGAIIGPAGYRNVLDAGRNLERMKLIRLEEKEKNGRTFRYWHPVEPKGQLALPTAISPKAGKGGHRPLSTANVPGYTAALLEQLKRSKRMTVGGMEKVMRLDWRVAVGHTRELLDDLVAKAAIGTTTTDGGVVYYNAL